MATKKEKPAAKTKTVYNSDLEEKKTKRAKKDKDKPSEKKPKKSGTKTGGKKRKAKKKSKAPAYKDLKNYSHDGEKWLDKDGKEVTHKGTINFLESKAPSFKPGQSGNPKGYKKGQKNRSTILREMLSLVLHDAQGKKLKHPLDPERDEITLEEAVDAALIKRALRGDVRAIREIKDTLHGKIKNENEFSTPDGKPFQVVMVDDIIGE